MGVEKEGTKNGGYVGGFLHLFDWTSKPRKKLFASKSDLPGTYTACIEHTGVFISLVNCITYMKFLLFYFLPSSNGEIFLYCLQSL